jgi:hypothetical protein
MHRSGTSAITRGLQVLGVCLGDRFLPPKGDNKKGFWEDIDLYALNVEMLGALGIDWDHLAPIESGDVDALRKKGYFVRGVDLLRQKVSKTPVFGFKDPRVAKLLPFWKTVFSHCLLDVSYVLAIRHPISVARSLARRDGFDEEKSYLLWLGHVISSLSSTAGENRALVDYDLLMNSPEQELNRMAKYLDLEIDPEELQYYRSEYLDTGLQHTVYDLDDLLLDDACPPLVRDIYTTLLDVASDNTKIIDVALQNKVEHWADEFARIKSALSLLDRLYIKNVSATQAVAKREEQIKSLNQAVADRDEHNKSLNQAVADRDEHNKSLNQAVADRDEQIKSLNQAVADRDEQILNLNWDVNAFQNSTSWRVTKPVRYIGQQLKTIRRAVKLIPIVIRYGRNRVIWRKVWRILREEGVWGIYCALSKLEGRTAEISQLVELKLPGPTRTATSCMRMRVLLIAETSLPQCFKYRVKQKQEMLEYLGIDCTICDWVDVQSCLNALQAHSLVIFYRVPDLGGVLDIIAEAKRLRIPTYWEVDDLIFDRQLLADSKNLLALDKEDRNGVLKGAVLYRRAMLACEGGVASTESLAQAMRSAGLPEVWLVENALDNQTMVIANEVNAHPKPNADNLFRIVYGSGTSTHDVDFEQAAPAIVHILKKYPEVRFRLIGKLNLPKEFSDYEEQIEIYPFCPYPDYFRILAECDVSITPLEPSMFNDAKSNIKYLEASAVCLPSVCSPAKAFVDVIEHKVNGMLAENTEGWISAFEVLLKNPEMRVRMSESAYQTVHGRYTPNAVASGQVLPILEAQEHMSPSKRILMVNIYYAPRSFGGATIVAEHLVRRLVQDKEALVSVFTTLPDDCVLAYGIKRYEVDGAQVFAMGLPGEHDAVLQYDNPKTLTAFQEVLRATMPEVVHIHSIQGIGATIIDACKAMDIPVVVTLHDAWWICGRGFMVNRQGYPCYQDDVDLSICDTCVDDPKLNRLRQRRLHDLLMRADRLLTPSEYFRDLYLANGFSVDKITVNKNGVLPPGGDFRSTVSKNLRFGYVGGRNAVKGFDILCQAFSMLSRRDYKLVVVDSTQSLGFSSLDDWSPDFKSQLSLVPSFDQNGLDEFFGGIDVLLFPTLCKESFGLIVREALMRDVWVVTTAAGGVVEDIEDGVNGTILPIALNPELLSGELDRLLDDTKKVKAFVNSHKGEIQTVDGQADELWRVYCECIN